MIQKIFYKSYYLFTSVYFRLLHGIQIGQNCKIHFTSTIRGNVIIEKNVSIGKFCNISGNVTIGKKTNIADFARINTMPEGKIEIGEDCHINVFNIIGSSNKVIIGNHALFAAGVKITDASHGMVCINEIIKHAPFNSQELSIGSNCWLGFDVNVIMGGGIGDNCVIGSQSLVKTTIPSNTVSVGTPAKVIKTREIIEK